MMFDPILLMIYVPICALVGFLGRNRSVGFAGVFTFSLILSPILVALVLLVSAPSAPKKSA
ncbi:MAG: hypothetical protein Q8S94_07625 [Pseudohongiella sp.]|jgi:hypothetical protein|nr:hypothetical protein [Pseudohongiella sp.]